MRTPRRPAAGAHRAKPGPTAGPRPAGILWASPLPPIRSGVADYAAEVLPELSNLTDVVVLAPPDWEAPAPGERWAELPRLPADAPTPRGFVSLVHMGNNPYHLWVARRLREHGGIVVLHDSVLHHLLVEEAAADGDWSRFGAELAAAHGQAGVALSAARSWGFQGRLDPFLFPARSVYLKSADGVVVHNRRAAQAVERDCPGVPVRTVPLAVAALPSANAGEMRRALRAAEGELLVTHLGFLTPAKGLGQVLRGLAAAVAAGAPVRLAVVGEGSAAEDFLGVVRRAGLADRVTCWGYAAPETLGAILAASDLGVAPRFPTAGETSAAVLRFLAAGTPVIVSGYGQFLEFPREATPRVAPGGAGVAELARILVEFSRDDSRLRAASKAARRAWSEGGHSPRRAAAALLAAAQEIAAR